MKFFRLKVSIIGAMCCLCFVFEVFMGLREISSLKKSLGNRLEAAEEDILRVLVLAASGSSV